MTLPSILGPSPRPIPADYATNSMAKMKEEKAGDRRFRQAVGCLMWAANITRPDIVNAVHEAARHWYYPPAAYWLAAYNVFRYLKGTGIGV